MINISDKSLIINATSKGNQIKCKVGDMWYKLDTLGYEALSEVIVSNFLLHNNIECVEYCFEEVLYKGEKTIACKCKNLTNSDEDLISVYRMLSLVNFDERIYQKASTADRISCITDIVNSFTNLKKDTILSYLYRLIYIDSIFLNEDRHLANIMFIHNNASDVWRCAPIFDNGAALLSDTKIDYDLSKSVTNLILKVKSKPFNTDFRKQLSAIESLTDYRLQLNNTNTDFLVDLIDKSYYNEKVKTRVKSILKLQFSNFLRFFADDNTLARIESDLIALGVGKRYSSFKELLQEIDEDF